MFDILLKKLYILIGHTYSIDNTDDVVIDIAKNLFDYSVLITKIYDPFTDTTVGIHDKDNNLFSNINKVEYRMYTRKNGTTLLWDLDYIGSILLFYSNSTNLIGKITYSDKYVIN